jgi:putative oxidoreductase
MAAATSRVGRRTDIRTLSGIVFRTDPSTLGIDVAVLPVRIALVWIFFYYGAGKLFGAFNGPGIHSTALFMSNTAHLHPGGFFAVLGGVIEFGGALAVALGVGTRFAGLVLFGDQVVAMITVSWVHGINSLSATPGYEFNLALAAMALVIVGLGAGRLSLDAVIERRLQSAGPSAVQSVVEDPPSPGPEQLRPRADTSPV